MKYLSCTETAKLVRKALKAAFPGVKFSVQSKTYSGGASIDISWIDGPTDKAVQSIAWLYQGAGFDGSIDLQYQRYHYMLPDGTVVFGGSEGTAESGGMVTPDHEARPEGSELVHFGADFVFCDRRLSADLLTKAARTTCERYGEKLLPVKTNGAYAWISADGPYIGNAYLSQHIYRTAQEMAA